MRRILTMIFFAAVLCVGTTVHAAWIEYEMNADESIMLTNIDSSDRTLNLDSDFEAVSYDANGEVYLQSNFSPVSWVKSGGYAIITAVTDKALKYNDTYYSIEKAPHPAIKYITIEPDQCIELTEVNEGNNVIISEPELSDSNGSFLYAYEWPNFYKLSAISHSVKYESVYIVAQNARQVVSVPYDSFEIKDLGTPFFTECEVDKNGMYFTCIKGDSMLQLLSGTSGYRFRIFDTETGESISSGGRSSGPFYDNETVFVAASATDTLTVRYMTDYFKVSSDSPLPTPKPTATPTLRPTATPTLRPTVTPTLRPTAMPNPTATPKPTAAPTSAPTLTPSASPTSEPTLPPTDKSMRDMTIPELIRNYPVKDNYSASSEVVLFGNMQEIAVLYEVCDIIADKVDDMDGEEYAAVSQLVDEYLHSVDNAYGTLNVKDFSAVEKSSQYSELSERRENVNAKIALEPPKIVSVDAIYPSADFMVEVHSMYTTKTKREYALEFSNLSKRQDISITNGSIGKNSYSDRLTLYSENCEAKNRVKIDIVYNGVNCSDTKGCSFTGTVLESDTKSEWAENEIDAAIALGLVPEELQKNYTSRISRRGFCLLAARAVEVSTGQDINSYALSHGHENNSFSDTVEPEILSSARLGIVYGYEDGTFQPNSDITREQAAAMLSRCAKLLGMSYGSVGGTFADSALISQWAAESVAFVRSNEIMAGDTENNFMPLGGYTVEQAIATFYRMYKKL